MLAQPGDVLTYAAQFTKSGAGVTTGLTGTVTFEIDAPAGYTQGLTPTEKHRGVWVYTYTVPGNAAAGAYLGYFVTTNTSAVDLAHVPALYVIVASYQRLDTTVSGVAAAVWAVTVRTLSAAGVQAVWDALTSALTTVGSVGKRIADDLDTTVSSRNATAPDNTSIATILTRTDVATSTRSSHTAADVWTVGTRTLTSLGTLAADTATAVWAAATRTLTAFGFPVTLATGVVTVTAPVASTGDITLTAGNDYGPSPSNLPRVLISLTAGAAPDLTGATVSLGIQNNATTYAGTVITASPTGAQVVEIPLTATQTTALAAALGSGSHRYTVDITTATGSKVQSVATGSLTVRPRP